MKIPVEEEGEMAQNLWRWCNRCQGLFYSGSPTSGTCPAGGGHNYQGSGNYSLHDAAEVPPGVSQSQWRWCHKCQGLFYGPGLGGSHCPTGGTHDSTGSANYALQFAPTPGQDQWRWCNRCQGLFYSGNPTTGWCPASGGGGHNWNMSGDYSLPVT
jgi:hypothetical protein